MQNPGIFLSFIAGILSIFSPCILPILPSFLGYIGGLSLSNSYQQLERGKLRRKLIIDTLFFGLGFSIIFVTFGAVIGLIGQTLLLNQPLFQKIGGVIIILFGLQLTGIIKIKTLLKEKKIELPPKLEKIKYFRSFMIGMFFALGWAPCYGPIIGSIFTLAATQENFSQALLLFSFYSLGFILPLIIFSIFISHLNNTLKKIKKILPYSSLLAGSFVIILGLLLFTNNLSILVNWINSLYEQNNINLY